MKDFLKTNWMWIATVIALIAVLGFTLKSCDKAEKSLQSIENTMVASQGTVQGLNTMIDKLGSGYNKISSLLGISDSIRKALELKLKLKAKTVYIEKPVIKTVTDTIIKGVAYQDFTEVSGSVAVSRSDADSTVDWIDRVAIKYDVTGFKLTFDETVINFKYDQLVPADMDWYLRGTAFVIGLILGIVI